MQKRIAIAVVTAFFLCVGALGLAMYHALPMLEQVATPLKEEPSAAEQCAHLYNTGQHRAWAECMGVTYR